MMVMVVFAMVMVMIKIFKRIGESQARNILAHTGIRASKFTTSLALLANRKGKPAVHDFEYRCFKICIDLKI